MRRALLLTAYDRADLLVDVVETWARVPELRSWHVRVAAEPSPRLEVVLAAVRPLQRAGADVDVVVNTRRLGVAENPYRHLSALFDDGYGFVARTEDDLLVADDVLRLIEWCAGTYAADAGVAAVCAYSRAPAGADPAAVVRSTDFTPWLWGTWSDRWAETIGPTWDRDYSTWNVSPGYESGWDWNLNTRVLPARGLRVVAPSASRVQNIGVHGVHGTADLHETAASFRADFGHPVYREARPGDAS